MITPIFILRVFVMATWVVGLFSGISSSQSVNTSENMTRGLMPVPAIVNWKAGELRLTKDFNVTFAGQTDDRLRTYVFRAMRRLEDRTVIQLPREFSSGSNTGGLIVEARSTGNAIPKLGDDESYTLEVDR